MEPIRRIRSRAAPYRLWRALIGLLHIAVLNRTPDEGSACSDEGCVTDASSITDESNISEEGFIITDHPRPHTQSPAVIEHEDAYNNKNNNNDNNYSVAAAPGVHNPARHAGTLLQCVYQRLSYHGDLQHCPEDMSCLYRGVCSAALSAFQGLQSFANNAIRWFGAMLETAASWAAGLFFTSVHVMLQHLLLLQLHVASLVTLLLSAWQKLRLFIRSKAPTGLGWFPAGSWQFMGIVCTILAAIVCVHLSPLGSTHTALFTKSIGSPASATKLVPEALQHVRECDAEALDHTADGILSVAALAKESEALMLSNSALLHTTADAAARYGMRALTLAESTVDQIRKDQVVKISKKLHRAAYDSRMLGYAERALCADSAFEYQNITVQLNSFYADLQVGLASGNSTVLAQMMQSTYESLHGILDWAVREDGTYAEEQHLAQERATLARQLQTISLEISLLVPGLPSLADVHNIAANVLSKDSDQALQRAKEAWFGSTKTQALQNAASSYKAAAAHTEAAKELWLVQVALQKMYIELTSGSVHDHMQLLVSKHATSRVSREKMLAALRLAKSVSVDPALVTYLIEFLGDMRQAIDAAASKAAEICSGSAAVAAGVSHGAIMSKSF